MKNLEKKIVCILVVIFICICSALTIVSYVKTKDIEASYTKKHPLNDLFINVYGKSNRLLGKTLIEDSEIDFYLLNNNKNLARKLIYVNTTRYQNKLYNFKNYLSNLGINYSFIITAEAGDERSGLLPLGIETNYCEQVTNELSTVLSNCNINHIATFDYLNQGPRSYCDYFYKTDHHWNDYAGLYLSEIITKHLNNKYNLGLNSDLFSLDNHEIITYDNLYLGSLGKKVGMGYVYPEDFTILVPKFETNFYIPRYKSIGAYSDSILFTKNLTYDPYNKDAYRTYLNGDHDLLQIQNLKIKNGKRILVLKDSKANVISAHLACAVENLDIIDLRHYKGSLKEFIEKTKPDVVLNIQSAFSFANMYDFE